MDSIVWVEVVHDHGVHRGSVSVDESGNVAEYLPSVDSNRVGDRPELVPVLEASVLGQERPIAGQAEHQLQQLDTAEDGRLEEQEGAADLASLRTDRHFEEGSGVP